MPVPETPKSVGRNFNHVIDKLNSQWDLQLPRLHGLVAELAENDGVLPRRITSRIRFLCFRPHLNLESLVADFEEKAKQVKSNWVYKPNQEAGTLPRVPNGRNRLFEESLPKPLRLTASRREELWCYLDKLLDDEYRRSHESQTYQRSSGENLVRESDQGSPTRGRSPARPMTPEALVPAASPTRNVMMDSRMANNSSTAATQKGKKRSPSRDAIEVTESPTKRRSTEEKRQTCITDSFRVVKPLSFGHDATLKAEKGKLKDEILHFPNVMPPPPSLARSKSEVHLEPSALLPTTTPATSFDSNSSVEPPKVFTPPDGQVEMSSNETSFQSTDPQLGSQKSYLCSQNTVDALDRSFHGATEPAQVDDLPEPNFEAPYMSELSVSGPFQESKALFPPDTSFRKRYEILRISQSAGLDVADLMSSTLSCGDDYQKLWAATSVLVAGSTAKLPKPGQARAWETAHGSYRDDTKSVIFSGTLEWNKHDVRGLFHLRLQPLKLEESCRFHRAYGSDRFMSISMPSLARYYLPEHLKHHHEAVHVSITEWLATCEHNIAGRTWKVFFVESAKRRWKKRTRDIEEPTKREKAVNIQGFKIHLFAVDGIDFLETKGPSPPDCTSVSRTRYSIGSLLDWHVPIGWNLDSTDLKSFQRFALGLSQTLPTIVLERSEFVHIENRRKSPKDPVMNDGCARISATLGRAIADMLGLEEVPSVFQARIAGAKGVWMVDHDDLLMQTYPMQMERRKFCIEVSESQLKIKPHPMDTYKAHATQRTFEVVAWSTMPRPASLNFQILAILYNRGVSKEVLTELLLADHCHYHEALFQAMNSRVRLREWIEQNRVSVRSQEDITLVGAWPDEVDEQIVILLESGFMPQDCPLLLERIRSCLKKSLDQYVDKLQIRVPQSTYLYCIADPYDVLQPDEVHIGFSGSWKDPITGLSANIIDGIDVLVGRLPALLPSDIQRRKAVWRKELQHFRNVVVFPSTGNVCLAELLSGGDYDGDMPWVCWDKSIVEAFQNVEVPHGLPSKADCKLVNKSRDLPTIFSNVSTRPSPNETEDFFRGCFRFNLHPPLLGTCTSEHEKVSYHEGSLSHDGAHKLAALAGYLVDSSKQGYLLSNQYWQEFRNAISPCRRETPAYKEKENKPVPKGNSVIDFLKFRIAADEREKTLAEFHRKWPRKSSHISDPALTSLWRAIKQEASSDLSKVLERLQEDVKAIGLEWVKSIPRDAIFKDDGFSRMVTPLHQKFCGLQPLHDEHELSARWIVETGATSCHWHRLRASCLYATFPSRKMCWSLAGQDLCRIKLDATGLSRAVLLEIYKIYKPDKRIVKRIAEQEEGEDEVEEVRDD